jgi:AraC family transcriptional regulator
MARLNDMIDYDLGSDLSLSALSEAVGLSKPHFVRLFRNTTGTSPHRYVIQKRLNRAQQLLRSSGASLTSIALDVGFASQSHMSRTFRSVIGITPGEMQKQLNRAQDDVLAMRPPPG